MSEYLSNNARSDDEEDDRTSLSPLQVSWESNTSSNHCTICNASFGRLTKRRHHCRYCGRLVCGNCSRHRVYLQNLGINVPATNETDQNNNRSKSSAASSTANQPVRVCDPCFRILTVKEEKIVEKRQLKEKKAEMLTSTSFISNCLVEIYFLDGEHTAVTYDESTTVLEISQILYPTLPISLFEVMEDIYDPKQYILLQGNQNISQILQHWVMSGQKFAKLIFPVMISTLVKQPLGNIMKNLKEIKSNEENSSHFKASNAPVTSPDAEVSILQGEIDRLQYELDKANRKIETWRGIFNRTNRARTAEILEQNSLQDPSSDAMSVTDGNNDVSDTATVVSNMPVNASASKSAGRRSSFGWNVLGDVRSSIRSSIRMGLVGSSEPSKANNNDDVGDYSFSQQNKDSLLNASMMYNESNDDASSQPSSGKKASISRNPTINTRSSGASTDNLLSLLSANSGGNSLASTSLEELASMFGNLNFGSNSTEVAILNNPIDFMKKDDSEVTLFVRTYFHHTINLMGFFSKYGNFFENILKFIRTYLIEDAFQEEKRQLSLYHQRNYSNDNDNGGTRSTEDAMSQSAKDSFLFCKWVSSIYHMIVTLDTVYEQIIDYYDILRPALKQWLIVLFPQTIVLPISEPDRVKSIMSCLIKENLLLDHQILQSIQQSITNSIFQNILVVTSYSSNNNNNTIGNTTQQHRTSYRTFTEMMKQLKDQLRHRTLSYTEVLSPLMKNILMTCQYIIGDYLQIFPSDIPVMTYFQTQSYEIWNVLIKPYYRELVNHQSSLSSSEMMMVSNTSSSSLPHSSAGSGGSVFFRLLEIYLFLEKYIILIDKFNPATSSKESLLFLERLKEKKIEIIGLLNTSLTQELKTKIKQLSTPSSSSSSSSSSSNASNGVGFEIVGNVDNFRQVLKKVSQDDPSTSMTNNNNTASSRLRSRKSNTTLQHQGDDDHSLNDVSEGNNNSNNTSSWLMLSSQYPLFQWCVELSQYYDSFLEYTFQQQEYMHAQGSNTSKGNIQITFFTLLLESIISDLLPMIHDYIHYQLKMNDKDYILKIITSMNSITYFHYQYIELMEEYCNNSNNMHMHNNHNNTYYFNDDIIEHYFENKILLIQTSLLDYHTMIIDMICRNYFFNDLKVCFTDTLFNNIWLKDMKGIISMKKMIRTGLLQFNALLLPASSGSSSINDDSSGGSGSNNSQNLAEIVKHKLLVSIIEGIISMYLELLFNNGYQQYPLLSMEVIDRLSEDLQMITSFFEELRQMILHYQYYAQNMHIIPILPKNKRKTMKALRFLSSNNTNSNPTQTGGAPSTPTAAVEGSSKKKRSFFSSKRSTHSSSSSSLAGGGGMMTTVIGPKKELIIKNIQNKQLFDELLFPLQHVIYAIQMNKQHLLDFVKNEFYLDFGYYNSIRIWQLLLAWRGMKKEEIYQEYDAVLKDWRPEDIDSMEPKLYLTYLLHHKTNVLKITRQNEK